MKKLVNRFVAALLATPVVGAETVDQTKRYRDSLRVRPDWHHEVETAVVEVYSNLGYRWFPIA